MDVRYSILEEGERTDVKRERKDEGSGKPRNSAQIQWERIDKVARSIYARILRNNGMSRTEAQDVSQLPWHYLGDDIRRSFRRKAIIALRDSRVRKAADEGRL